VRVAVIGPGGIGGAVIRALQAAGHEVVVGWHERSGAPEEFSAAGARIDVTDFQSCRDFFATVWREAGPCTALVNCFGVVQDAPLIKDDPESMSRQVSLNLMGVLQVCRAVAFRLMKARDGAIVNIGSAVTELGLPGLSVYSATKSALTGFGRSLAVELAPYHVTCNTVLPGFVDCGGTASRPPDWKKTVERHIPLGRLGSPTDIAAMVTYLVSPSGRYITGQEFVVDGGWTLGSPALARDLAEISHG
jgi:NAD(P)-dependent dehydrogenase (short-subunit alcohol dehydrogenase family)